MEVFYCGFNGFQQVPSSNSSDTLTCLTPHTKNAEVVDVAICWNYMVVAEKKGVTKYGLVNNKPCLDRLDNPPGSAGVAQLSATPRHVLCVTDTGECWTNEEGKGWRRVLVTTEVASASTLSDDTITTIVEDDAEEGSSDAANDQDTPATDEPADPQNTVANNSTTASPSSVTPDNEESPVCMISTACGDYHNLGLDTTGQAYSLPSPLHFSSIPGGAQQKVTEVVCGKEHCMLLTEHGQVYSWGGGSRGQLGHGTVTNEDSPRLVMALDGMKIIKIAAGGWHSAAISEFHDLYMFGWNESGQLAQQTNLAKPAECFSAVEKLLMACCTMQAEDAALPRGDTEDTEVYRKHDDTSSMGPLPDPEKEALNCYPASSCDNNTDCVMVQSLPMLVSISGKTAAESAVIDVGCGSRHTVCLTQGNNLWSFGWNKYGQLGLGDTRSRDCVAKMVMPPRAKQRDIAMLRCGDWGTAIVTSDKSK